MTSPSFLACTHFLITLKFCFTPAPFFFPRRSSPLVLPGPKTAESFQPRDAVAEIEMGKGRAHLFPPPIPPGSFFAFNSPPHTVPHLKD